MTAAPRPLDRADAPAAARALARALTDDPGWIAVLRDDATRTARLARVLAPLLRAHYLPQATSWGVADDDGLAAAAIGSPPGGAAIPPLTQLRLLPRLALAIRGGALAGLAMMSAMDDGHPAEPHYYLAFLGVDPAHQGRGLGPRVLAPLLDRCDAERRLAWLESTNPRNHTFYRRAGFAPVAERAFPTGVTMTWFARQPR